MQKYTIRKVALYISHFLKLLHKGAEVLFPPRKTEKTLNTSTIEEFEALVRLQTRDGVESLLPYSDTRVQALIWELKYRDSSRAAKIASLLISQYLNVVFAEEMITKALLVPMPLHIYRQRTRGFNQCERIANGILQNFPHQITLAPTVSLVRIKNTPRQTTMPRAMRLTNIKDAFIADPTSVAGKTIILIDDVTTTGSTLEEARKVLRASGAFRVIAIALAHA